MVNKKKEKTSEILEKKSIPFLLEKRAIFSGINQIFFLLN